jgi:hypothetical protein
VQPRQQAMLVYSETNRKGICVIDPQAISNRCSLENYSPYKAFMEERPTSMRSSSINERTHPFGPITGHCLKAAMWYRCMWRVQISAAEFRLRVALGFYCACILARIEPFLHGGGRRHNLWGVLNALQQS